VAARSLKVFALPVMSLAAGRGRYGCCTLMLQVLHHSGEMV
jgi:hypothetical protein